MFMKKMMPNKERVYILITGGMLIILGCIYRFYPLIDSFNYSNDEINIREAKILKYRQIASERDSIENRFNHLNREIERVGKVLLNGTTPALAAVDLQNMINDIAKRSGVEISTMRVLTAEKLDHDDYLKIPVEFSLESNVRQIKEMLYQIESSSKFLAIGKASLRSNNRNDFQTMNTTLVVYGIMEKK